MCNTLHLLRFFEIIRTNNAPVNPVFPACPIFQDAQGIGIYCLMNQLTLQALKNIIYTEKEHVLSIKSTAVLLVKLRPMNDPFDPR